MELDGFDKTFFFNEEHEDLALSTAIRTIKSCWPHAIFEDDLMRTLSASVQPSDLWEVNEVFAYQNEAARQSWLEDGATKTNYDQFMQLLKSPRGFTVVVGDPVAPETLRVHAELEKLSNRLKKTPHEPIVQLQPTGLIWREDPPLTGLSKVVDSLVRWWKRLRRKFRGP